MQHSLSSALAILTLWASLYFSNEHLVCLNWEPKNLNRDNQWNYCHYVYLLRSLNPQCWSWSQHLVSRLLLHISKTLETEGRRSIQHLLKGLVTHNSHLTKQKSWETFHIIRQGELRHLVTAETWRTLSYIHNCMEARVETNEKVIGYYLLLSGIYYLSYARIWYLSTCCIEGGLPGTPTGSEGGTQGKELKKDVFTAGIWPQPDLTGNCGVNKTTDLRQLGWLPPIAGRWGHLLVRMVQHQLLHVSLVHIIGCTVTQYLHLRSATQSHSACHFNTELFCRSRN